MLKSTKNAKMSTLELAGVFVAIGSAPNSAECGLLPPGRVGYIITNELMGTRISGIFAGDVCHDSSRQAITAAGDGATAAITAERFLSF
ncbi:MAG: FAD-dependent oxidoreductase [Chloroflexota bacterium]